MAFDVSSIVSAVNNYLYSISDINKTLSEEEATAKASGLAGLFEKILNNAVKNKTEEAVKDIDVGSALSLMASSSSEDSSNNSAFDISLSDEGVNLSSSLSKILGTTSSVSFDDASADAILAKALEISTGNTNAAADSAKALENSQRASDGLGLRAEIENNISNHNLLGNISDSFNTPDIKGRIEENIAQHNRVDEINSYNAARLSAYKNSSAKAVSSSVFGDYRL